jgi:hypothetical protein
MVNSNVIVPGLVAIFNICLLAACGAPTPPQQANAAFDENLNGRSCSGSVQWSTPQIAAEVVRHQGRDDSPPNSPIVATWFRQANGSPWVHFKLDERSFVDLPVRLAPGFILFTGQYGSQYVLNGNSHELIGYSVGLKRLLGTVHLSCADKQT